MKKITVLIVMGIILHIAGLTALSNEVTATPIATPTDESVELMSFMDDTPDVSETDTKSIFEDVEETETHDENATQEGEESSEN